MVISESYMRLAQSAWRSLWNRSSGAWTKDLEGKRQNNHTEGWWWEEARKIHVPSGWNEVLWEARKGSIAISCCMNIYHGCGGHVWESSPEFRKKETKCWKDKSNDEGDFRDVGQKMYSCLTPVCLRAYWCPSLLWPHGLYPPGPSVHGISQARILEWAAISSSRGSSWQRGWTLVSCISCIGRQILCPWAT